MPKNTVQAIELFSIASSVLDVNYQAINEDGAEGACFLLRITNDSTTNVTISYNGLVDHDIVLPGDVLNINAQTNSRPNNQTCLFPKGQIVYAKGTAGTGTIYLTGYYQE